MNKKKAAYASGWMGRKKDRWNSMKLWSGNDLCRLDWILSFLILAVLFVTCAHSDVKLTGNRSFLMYEHFADFYQERQNPVQSAEIVSAPQLHTVPPVFFSAPLSYRTRTGSNADKQFY